MSEILIDTPRLAEIYTMELHLDTNVDGYGLCNRWFVCFRIKPRWLLVSIAGAGIVATVLHIHITFCQLFCFLSFLLVLSCDEFLVLSHLLFYNTFRSKTCSLATINHHSFHIVISPLTYSSLGSQLQDAPRSHMAVPGAQYCKHPRQRRTARKKAEERSAAEDCHYSANIHDFDCVEVVRGINGKSCAC